MTQTATAAPETRRAPLALTSYRADTRTVEAVLSAGAPVSRWGYTETLEISPQAVDLARVENGLVRLLDSHQQHGIDNVLGSITACRFINGELHGTIAFADTEAGRKAEGMVSRGEIRGISVGYRVTRWEITQAGGEQPEQRTATGWELLEVSLVPVPADPAAGTRSLPSENRTDLMTTVTTTNGGDPAATRFTVTEAMDFLESALNFGRSDDIDHKARALIQSNAEGGIGKEAARSELLRFLGERQRAQTSGIRGSHSGHDGTFENPDFMGRAISEAIYARMSGKRPEGPATQFAGLTIVDMARQLLGQSGNRDARSMSAVQVIETACRDVAAGPIQSTSHLPNLLKMAGNRFLLERYEAAQSVFKQVARIRSVSDFREIGGIDTGWAATLDEKLETGEIKNKPFLERAEKPYRIKTYANIFALTREALVNDDLGAFTDAMGLMSRAAAETEANVLAELLVANPVMADGKTLFHADHGNLAGSGAAPSVATFDTARQSLRGQKDLAGGLINVTPRYVITGPALETAVEVITASTIAPTTLGEVNPFASKLVPLVEPRLAGNAWYLFGDPNGAPPVIELAYLNGMSVPQIQQQDGWRHLGTEWRVVFDVGAGIVDWRGAYKNPGA